MDEACISTTFAAVWALSNLDLGAPEARPIVRLLEGMPSALRFALDHPLVHFGAIGLSSASFCAVSPAHTRKLSHSPPHWCLGWVRADFMRAGVREG